METKKRTFHVGEKIRSVRERKGFTLKTVAQRAGVSESLISQIERNRVSPAIDTLLSIADALEIDLEYLFSGYRQQRPVRLITAEERQKITENNVIYEEVVHPNEGDGIHALEAYYLTVPPGGETKRGSYGHSGREFGIIIQGNGELRYGSSVYVLKTGDSISFSAGAPHTLANKEKTEPLRAFWVVTPPQRFR